MAEEGTKGALSQLYERESRLASELRDVQTAIRVLGGEPGAVQVGPSPEGGAVNATNVSRPTKGGPVEIRPDTFYGMSQHQAAKQYLLMVGHADTLDNIFQGLQAGGIEIGGARPLETLRVTMVQNSKVFVRVSSRTFGLREFYPHIGEKVAKPIPKKAARKPKRKPGKPKEKKPIVKIDESRVE